jgi:hypothetical protein
MEKSAADMTVEEFSAVLKNKNDEVINFQTYLDKGKKDMRAVASSTRRYNGNMKKGNFQGRSKWVSLGSHYSEHCSPWNSREPMVKQAIEGLKELNNTVKMRTDSLGRPRGGKYDG